MLSTNPNEKKNERTKNKTIVKNHHRGVHYGSLAER